MKGGGDKIYTRICVGCGKVLLNVGRAAKRCPACAQEHDKLRRYENDARNHAESVRNYFIKKHDDSDLLADVRAADAAGLSYGKYMVQKNKKPAGAPTPTSCKG